jgi:hypothetical protein
MGNKFDTFIKSLSDHELAIYIDYQYSSCLSYSKELLKKEIIRRNLSKDKLKYYINTKLSYDGQGPFCERCGSNIFFDEIDVEQRGFKYSYLVEIHTSRCRLCNYNPSKAPAKNIFERIKRIFSDKNKTEKTLKKSNWFDL